MRRKKLIQEQFHTLQLPLESKDIILSLIDLLEKDVTPDQKHNIEKSIKKRFFIFCCFRCFVQMAKVIDFLLTACQIFLPVDSNGNG